MSSHKNNVKEQKQPHMKRIKVGEQFKETNDETMSSNGPLTIITDPYDKSYLKMNDLTSISSTSSLNLTFNSPNKLSNRPLIDLTPLSLASGGYNIKKSKRDPIVEYDAELAQSIEYELSLKKRRPIVSGFRKNSWGNLTYAELITRAIESSAEQRLTMPEIYAWIVRYVPYFKEKHDRKSTAGLKNSIRHNLSLHSNLFIRVKDESAGKKSSWWMINREDVKNNSLTNSNATNIEGNCHHADADTSNLVEMSSHQMTTTMDANHNSTDTKTLENCLNQQHLKSSEDNLDSVDVNSLLLDHSLNGSDLGQGQSIIDTTNESDSATLSSTSTSTFLIDSTPISSASSTNSTPTIFSGSGLKNTWSCENKSIFSDGQQFNKTTLPTSSRQLVETNSSNMRPVYYADTSSLYTNTNGSYQPSQLVFQSVPANYYPTTSQNYNYNYSRPNGAKYDSQYYRANDITTPYYTNVSSSIFNQPSVANNNFVVGQNGLIYSATSGQIVDEFNFSQQLSQPIHHDLHQQQNGQQQTPNFGRYYN